MNTERRKTLDEALEPLSQARYLSPYELGFAIGKSDRERELSYAQELELCAFLNPEAAKGVLAGYRGTVEYPQLCGSGAHLWRVGG